VPVSEIDLRPGGAWKFVNRRPQEVAFYGVHTRFRGSVDPVCLEGCTGALPNPALQLTGGSVAALPLPPAAECQYR
jgi:hypothetical protein